MSDRTCILDGCELKAYSAKQWCRKHYERLVKFGSTDLPPRRRTSTKRRGLGTGRRGPDTSVDRFRKYTKPDPSTGCHIFGIGINGKGYGTLTVSDDHGISRSVMAHRFAYELAYGPIAPGLQIDHLCYNRRCVNPEHMEAVTHEVNQARRRDRLALKTTP